MSFAKFDNQRPPIPPETCPLIDRISVNWDAICGDIERIAGELGNDAEHVEELEQAAAGLQRLRHELEIVRKANEELRLSGIYWRSAAQTILNEKKSA